MSWQLFCVTLCLVKGADGATGKSDNSPDKRPYRMSTRRESVERTRVSILEAAYRLWLERPYDEVGLEEIADAAGVARQTVHRQFGSKDDLLVAVTEWRRPREEETWSRAEPGDVHAAVAAHVDRHERMGDAVVRFLTLEGRIDAIDHLLATGRAAHRAEIEHLFSPFLPSSFHHAYERAVLALCAATDVMVWKLLRRDLGCDRTETEAVIRQLVDGVLRTLHDPT